MARINIEDSLFKDKRFMNLCIKLGNSRTALGALVEAWILAQSYVKPDNQSGHIPENVWNEQDIANEIIECKLARKVGDKVEIAGSKESFEWLVKLQINAQKGGAAKSKKSKDDEDVSKNNENEAAKWQPNGSQMAQELCPPSPTHTPSPVPSHSLFHDLSQTQQNNIYSAEPEKSLPTHRSKASIRGCIPEFQNCGVCNSLLEDTPHKAQYAWLTAYPSIEFIVFEIRKANAWCEVNTHKRPKNFARFMTNWLSNAFEKYRKGMPSNSPHVQKHMDAENFRNNVRKGLENEHD